MEEREQVKGLMLEDYERVIFYLLNKLGRNVNEINVVIKNGVDEYDFKVKKPFTASAGVSTPHVKKIEYLSEI